MLDWSNPKAWFSNHVYELLRPLFGQSSAGLRKFLSDSWGSWRLTLWNPGGSVEVGRHWLQHLNACCLI